MSHVVMSCAYCGTEVADAATLIVHTIEDCTSPPANFAGVPTVPRADYLDLARVWRENVMTGPEHYREAERLITEMPSGLPHEDIAMLTAAAQVHATLALVAATSGGERTDT